MTPLLLLLSLPFAGDLTALGHADYRTREAATVRLRAALPWSLPALLAPAGPDAESRIRRQALLRPVPTVAELGAAALLAGPAVWPPDRLPGFWHTPAGVAALDDAARRGGLLAADAAVCWDAPDAVVAILRGRASGRRLPFPIDPEGPLPAPMPSED